MILITSNRFCASQRVPANTNLTGTFSGQRLGLYVGDLYRGSGGYYRPTTMASRS
jgi:hypothetical protein